jgi:hypothetical protein
MEREQSLQMMELLLARPPEEMNAERKVLQNKTVAEAKPRNKQLK